MGLSAMFQKAASVVISPLRHIQNFLNRAFSGYGSALSDDLQRQAHEKLAASGLDNETINRKIDSKQVHVSAVFDSSNWTGNNFNGFKKPEAHVTIDEDPRPTRYRPQGPQL